MKIQIENVFIYLMCFQFSFFFVPTQIRLHIVLWQSAIDCQAMKIASQSILYSTFKMGKFVFLFFSFTFFFHLLNQFTLFHSSMRFEERLDRIRSHRFQLSFGLDVQRNFQF